MPTPLSPMPKPTNRKCICCKADADVGLFIGIAGETDWQLVTFCNKCQRRKPAKVLAGIIDAAGKDMWVKEDDGKPAGIPIHIHYDG